MPYKSPDSDLRKYFQTMATSIGYTVYDNVPDVADYPYVHLSDMTGTESSTATDNLYTVDVLFDIVTTYNGSKQSDTIGNAIMNYLINNYVDIGDFVVTQAQLLTYSYLSEYTEPMNIKRKLLRIEFIVEQI